MKNLFDSTSTAFALIATLSASLILVSARAGERLPLVLTEGLHIAGKGLAETSPVRPGESFSDKDEQRYLKKERECVEDQIKSLKTIAGSLKDLEQVTIVLNKDGRPLGKRYVVLKRPETGFLNEILGNNKPTLEVGGIVTYGDDGLPGKCATFDPLTIQQAIYQVDVSVIDNNKSVSKREGDKAHAASRVPAGYFTNGKGSEQSGPVGPAR
jgi:hypothetical protein